MRARVRVGISAGATQRAAARNARTRAKSRCAQKDTAVSQGAPFRSCKPDPPLSRLSTCAEGVYRRELPSIHTRTSPAPLLPGNTLTVPDRAATKPLLTSTSPVPTLMTDALASAAGCTTWSPGSTILPCSATAAGPTLCSASMLGIGGSRRSRVGGTCPSTRDCQVSLIAVSVVPLPTSRLKEQSAFRAQKGKMLSPGARDSMRRM
jgi:hypothetical protein